MPDLRLIGITCEKTQEAVDEPFLVAQIDGGTRSRIWGPTSMDDGEARAFHMEPLHYDSVVLIQLWEDDRHRDDHIGNLIVTQRDLGRGETRHLFSGRRARYNLSFEVAEVASFDCVLELMSLHCSDAQERTDEPYLTVNDTRVWGPVDMRTGDTQRVDRVIPFREGATIELWEADRSRSDRLGSTGVSCVPVGDQSARFHWGTSPRIDATYELRYRTRRA